MMETVKDMSYFFQLGKANVNLSSCKRCPYFVTFINLHASIFMIPFKLRIHSETGQYITASSKMQKLLCGISHTMLVILGAHWVGGLFSTSLHDKVTVSLIFYCASALCNYLGLLCTIKYCWLDEKRILEYVNRTSVPTMPVSENSSKSSYLSLKGRKLEIFMLVGCIIFDTTAFCHRFIYITEKNDIPLLRELLKKVLPRFGFEPLEGGLDQFFEMVEKFILSYVSLGVNTTLLIMMVLVRTSQLALDHFAEKVEQSYGKIDEVLDHYTHLKEAMELQKLIFGNMILNYFCCTLCFFAELPEILLSEGMDTLRRLFFLFYIVFVLMTIYGAVNLNAKAENCMRKFMSFHHLQKEWNCKERIQLIAIGQEMDNQPIGVSCAFFTFTNKFLRSTFGLVITYSLIVFQMSDKENLFWTH